ncbi:hypothetical protein TWF281_011449 [Arthrobotrys megalospora]
MNTTRGYPQTSYVYGSLNNNLTYGIAVTVGNQTRLFGKTCSRNTSSGQTRVVFTDALNHNHPLAYLLYDATVSVGEVEILGPNPKPLDPPKNLQVQILYSEASAYLTAVFRGQLPSPSLADLQALHPHCFHGGMFKWKGDAESSGRADELDEY